MFTELLEDLETHVWGPARLKKAMRPPYTPKSRKPPPPPKSGRLSATRRFQAPAPPPAVDMKRVLREQEKLLRKCHARTLLDRYDLERQRTDLDPWTAARLDALVPHLETARRLAG